jgi:hypothetical protein
VRVRGRWNLIRMISSVSYLYCNLAIMMTMKNIYINYFLMFCARLITSRTTDDSVTPIAVPLITVS